MKKLKAKKNLKFIIITFIALCIIIISLFNINFKNKTSIKSRPIPSVEVEDVTTGSLSKKINLVGTLVANQNVIIKSQVRGLISKILFKGGTEVKKGEPLVIIDDIDYKILLKEAEAKLNYAKSEYERAKKLASIKFGSEKIKEIAYKTLKEEEARIESIKLKIERCRIKAPFTGVVGLKKDLISVGTYVNEHQELLSLIDLTPIKIDFNIPAKYIRKISQGQKIKINIDGFEKLKLSGVIRNIDAQINPQTNSFVARGVLSNKKMLLKPGLFGRIELTAGAKDNILLVPESAVEIEGENSYVYKIIKFKGHLYARKTYISTGINDKELIEVNHGLKEHDRVVTGGLFKMHGDQLRIKIIGESQDSTKKDDSKTNS